MQRTIVSITRTARRRWRWAVDDLADRHGTYQGMAPTRAAAVAAAHKVALAIGGAGSPAS